MCLILMVIFNIACTRPYPLQTTQYIEPLGLYFHIDPEEEGVVFSFGEKRDSIFPNYFEIWNCGESDGRTFFFIVDNTSGTPEIKHIIFDPIQFMDIHIPDYQYSIDYFFANKPYCLRKIKNKSKIINRDAWLDADYYLVAVWPISYYKGLNYEVYRIRRISEEDSIADSFSDINLFLPYRDLKRHVTSLDYSENVNLHGTPKVSKRFNISEDSRKEMIKTGWLFLDTMDLRARPVIEIDKWKVDDNVLSILYSIDSDGERIPVNGARYKYVMEKQKETIHYK